MKAGALPYSGFLIGLAAVCLNPVALLGQTSQPSETVILVDDLEKLKTENGTILLRGQEAENYKRFREDELGSFTIQQCRIQGKWKKDFIELQFDLEIQLEKPGVHFIPLGIDSKWVTQSTVKLEEKSGKLIAILRGEGRKQASLTVQWPSSGSELLPHLRLGIPKAVIASLELECPRPIIESSIKVLPPVPVEPVFPLSDSRFLIHARGIGLRDVLDVQWRWSDGPIAWAVPSVRAITVVQANITTGIVQATTQLRLAVLKGNLESTTIEVPRQTLITRLTETDGEELEREELAAGSESTRRIRIQLPRPIKAGGSARITIESETPWANQSAQLAGIVVQDAVSHQGTVVVRSGLESHSIIASPGRNAKFLDDPSRIPREIRPDDLSEINGSFSASAQPYSLDFLVLPVSPELRYNATAAATVREDRYRVGGRWSFSTQGGKVAQVSFDMPGSFDASSMVHSEVVRAVQQEGSLLRVFLARPMANFDIFMSKWFDAAPKSSIQCQLPIPKDAAAQEGYVVVPDRGSSFYPETGFQPIPDHELQGLLANWQLDPGMLAEQYRGFRRNGALEAIQLDQTRSNLQLSFHSQLSVQLRGDQLEVTQDITFGRHPASIEIRLEVPKEIEPTLSFREIPVSPQKDPVDQTIKLKLRDGIKNPLALRLRYLVPLSKLSRETITIPMVVPKNSICNWIDAEVVAPRNKRIRIADPTWKPRLRTGHRTSESEGTESNRLWVRQIGPARKLPLAIVDQATISRDQTTIDQISLESTIDQDGLWETRALLLVSSVGDDKLIRIGPPSGGRIEHVQAENATIHRDPSSAVWELDLGDAPLPAKVTVICQSTAPLPLAWLGWQQLSAPQILGNRLIGRVSWYVAMPHTVSVLRGPADYSDDNRWVWRSLGAQKISRDNRSGLGMHYARLVNLRPLRLYTANRFALTLTFSLTALLLGFLMSAIPSAPRSWLGIVILCALLAIAAWEPDALVQLLQASALGLLIVPAAVWFYLQSKKKDTVTRKSVFPEPSELASTPPKPVMEETTTEYPAAPAQPLAQSSVTG